jgi:hypothetical protein
VSRTLGRNLIRTHTLHTTTNSHTGQTSQFDGVKAPYKPTSLAARLSFFILGGLDISSVGPPLETCLRSLDQADDIRLGWGVAEVVNQERHVAHSVRVRDQGTHRLLD